MESVGILYKFFHTLFICEIFKVFLCIRDEKTFVKCFVQVKRLFVSHWVHHSHTPTHTPTLCVFLFIWSLHKFIELAVGAFWLFGCFWLNCSTSWRRAALPECPKNGSWNKRETCMRIQFSIQFEQRPPARRCDMQTHGQHLMPVC